MSAETARALVAAETKAGATRGIGRHLDEVAYAWCRGGGSIEVTTRALLPYQPADCSDAMAWWQPPFRKHGRRRCVSSGVEPMTPTLEPVDGRTVAVTAQADAQVVAAWQAHYDELFAFLVRTTRDREAAEDLLGEAYLRLTRELRAGRRIDNTRAWLYQVAANLAVSRGRRVRTAVRILGGIVARTRAAVDDPPEAHVLAAEGRTELLAVLDALSPDARTALLLAGEGYSGPEIAAAIGRSHAATRTLLCRTRVEVRARLRGAEVAR